MRLSGTTPVAGGAIVGLALAGLLGASTYDAQAARVPSPATSRASTHHAVHDVRFVAPAPHKYGANGMRMGLHCETSDSS